MKTIIAGDSFTNGFELIQGQEWWRTVLNGASAHKDSKVVAKNMDSNEECFRKICRDIDQFQKVIVMWTFPSRVSFYPTIHLNPHTSYHNPVHSEFRDSFYTLTSDSHYVHNTWLNVLALQSICEARGVDYWFTTSTSELFRINDNSYTRDITQLPINWSRFFAIDHTLGLIEFARREGYPVSTTGHPLAAAHKEFGKRFKEFIDE
jgi:hypothetical protein